MLLAYWVGAREIAHARVRHKRQAKGVGTKAWVHTSVCGTSERPSRRCYDIDGAKCVRNRIVGEGPRRRPTVIKEHTAQIPSNRIR